MLWNLKKWGFQQKLGRNIFISRPLIAVDQQRRLIAITCTHSSVISESPLTPLKAAQLLTFTFIYFFYFLHHSGSRKTLGPLICERFIMMLCKLSSSRPIHPRIELSMFVAISMPCNLHSLLSQLAPLLPTHTDLRKGGIMFSK